MLTLQLSKSDRSAIQISVPATTAAKLELSLFNAQHQGIYQTIIPAEKATLILPNLSETPQRWTVAIICNESDRTEDFVLEGSVPNPRTFASLK